MTTNNRISNLVSTQLPFFVRKDHENFVRFVEAYYEYLEQNGKGVERAKNLPSYINIDTSLDEFIQHFYNQFINSIPDTALADRTLILKHVKDFYTSRGTEKSIRFLMRILFNDEVDFYYPQRDILRASDGKWFIEKSIKIGNLSVNGIANNDPTLVEKFITRRITGLTSNASALVEKVDSYYEGNSLVRELKISGQVKEFQSGEQITATFIDSGVTKTLTANLFSGSIASLSIDNPGSGYSPGQSIPVESNTGNGAILIIQSVSTGNLTTIAVLDGGAGFQNGSNVIITGGGGSGALANILSVNTSAFFHPNTYNIVSSIIALEANTRISNTRYANLNVSSIVNVNSSIANSVSYFRYANTGPISAILLYNPGSSYTGAPLITAEANTRIRNLGILGRMRIVAGGTGYRIGDTLEFINVDGGYGTGAAGRVRAVNTAQSNAISEVEFVNVRGHITGGAGYDQLYLPRVNVISTNASATGANIVVTAVLGTGEVLAPVGSTAGAIQSITISSPGTGYLTAPTINLRSFGDGTAQVSATIITGAYTYPGRYINDDGHLSSYNFLEDRDYYQKFSYVVRVKRSIEKYRKALKELIHPAGTKLFGEYLFVDEGSTLFANVRSAVTDKISFEPSVYAMLDGEPSGFAVSFTTDANSRLLVKSASTPALNYYGDPFSENGGKITFSRGGIATMVNKDQKVKWAPHNLLSYSEQFNNAYWLKFQTTCTGGDVNANVAPNGTTTADIIREDNTTNIHFVVSTNMTSINSGRYTFAVYLKYGSIRYMQFALDDTANGAFAVCDLIDGTITNTGTYGSAVQYIGSSIEAIGITGWYKVSITARLPPAAAQMRAVILTAQSATSGWAPSFAGSTNRFVSVWGAHVYNAELDMDLNPVTNSYYYSSNTFQYQAPRLEYDYNSGETKGLVVEQFQYNLFKDSDFQRTDWSLNANSALTSNSAISPSGRTDAAKIRFSPEFYSGIYQYVPYTPADGVFTMSMWIRGENGGETVRFLASNTNIYLSPVIELSENWKRYTFTQTVPLNFHNWHIINGEAGVSKNVYVWGAQVEYGPIATSYIPATGGSSISQRQADRPYILVTDFPYSSANSTIAAKFQIYGHKENNRIVGGFPNEPIPLYARSENRVGTWNDSRELFTAEDKSLRTVSKAAASYDATGSDVALNGVVEATDTNTMPTMSELRLGWSQSAYLNGWLKEVIYLPRRVTKTKLRTMSSNFDRRAFSPSELLFSSGEKGVLYDFSDLSTLFQDSAGTIPVTDSGQSVGFVLDKSGNGNHLFQTDSAKRPILQRDDNGRLYLLFNGSTTFMKTNTINAGSYNKAQMFSAVRKLVDAVQIIAEYSPAAESYTGTIHMASLASPERFQFWTNLGTSRGLYSTSGVLAPQTAILTGTVDGAAPLGQFRMNGNLMEQTTLSAGAGNYQNHVLWVGIRGEYEVNYPFNGRLYGLILRFSPTNLDNLTIAGVETWLANKTGISIN